MTESIWSTCHSASESVRKDNPELEFSFQETTDHQWVIVWITNRRRTEQYELGISLPFEREEGRIRERLDHFARLFIKKHGWD